MGGGGGGGPRDDIACKKEIKYEFILVLEWYKIYAIKKIDLIAFLILLF